MSTELTRSLFIKVDEQIELLQRLVPLIPPEQAQWRPAENSFRICDLLGHLMESLAGFCAALYVVHPERLAHLLNLRDLPVNHCCEIEEAGTRIAEYRGCITQASALLNDADLAKVIPTVFTKNGESLLTILLGNLEHLVNHKFQLYFYLKLLGVPVSTKELYKFRGD